MRKLTVVACFLALFVASAMAAETESYPKAEIFGGYQYSHLEGGINANGFDFAATGNFNNYFGITADLGSSFTTQSGVSLHNYSYTFGPQLALRANKAYTPFVHVLLGGDHASASAAGVTATGNGFALLAGGGADFNINKNFAFRGAADWMSFHNNGASSSKNVRMLMGVVIRY
ncbi:MAG TPA: outer membrane beta-barrel protein [Candidatus Sulfotelmatobacter sp.]|nr:outer membrane beta-barrel protein [Candidatus Sulfotelmatobacter sp.]